MKRTEFWRQVFLAMLSSKVDPMSAAETADEALVQFDERFGERFGEEEKSKLELVIEGTVIELPVAHLTTMQINALMRVVDFYVSSAGKNVDTAPARFEEQEWKRPSASELIDLLALAGVYVGPSMVSSWSDEQVYQAEAWANALYNAASDSSVDVPPKPVFLPDFGVELHDLTHTVEE